MEDRILANAAANGDQDAFTTLIERYSTHIYTIAYKITLNEEDALDVSQNVYEKLVKKIGGFKGHGTFRSWLTVITTNTAIDSLRKMSRQELSSEPENLDFISSGSQVGSDNNPREIISIRKQKKLIENAMKKLSPQQRAIFALRFKEDMRPKEIAASLSIPAQQVRSQLCRAIDKIRQTLNGRVH